MKKSFSAVPDSMECLSPGKGVWQRDFSRSSARIPPNSKEIFSRNMQAIQRSVDDSTTLPEVDLSLPRLAAGVAQLMDKGDSKSKSSESKSPPALTGVAVAQGNGKGKTIGKDEAGFLYTTDLGPCVAIVGFDGSTAYMLHSDSNDTSGVGGKSLEDGMRDLGMLKSGITLGFYGGADLEATGRKVDAVKAFFSDFVQGPVESSEGALIAATGQMARSNAKLKEALGSEDIRLIRD